MFVYLLEGSLRNTFVIPLGGNNITKDISILLKSPYAEAERIKMQFGNAFSRNVNESENIQIGGIAGRKVRVEKRKFLSDIIQARIEEILFMVYENLDKIEY
jgi:cell division protein FtsA